VLVLDTTLDAHALLDALQAIENAHGRQRPFPNAPRVLDLDLLWHAQGPVQTPRLSLPHPRLHQRAFVLRPLAEILGDHARLPSGQTIQDALRVLGDQRIERSELPWL
jgi:2-amino-4-hydroxy-6-hydroxymethyldihydropteridine diphosphokinase